MDPIKIAEFEEPIVFTPMAEPMRVDRTQFWAYEENHYVLVAIMEPALWPPVDSLVTPRGGPHDGVLYRVVQTQFIGTQLAAYCKRYY